MIIYAHTKLKLGLHNSAKVHVIKAEGGQITLFSASDGPFGGLGTYSKV